eukprot:TRINITY_DN7862_c0_g1_i1.p2 TRINITY_DN7862_c0_g1~~TRINITY_DN7862_c0_g1_i1.p2  ORF type:complete len:51 (-),score=7.67 TRINITY_DN7862_c0_g1_i1:176-328(-)
MGGPTRSGDATSTVPDNDDDSGAAVRDGFLVGLFWLVGCTYVFWWVGVGL